MTQADQIQFSVKPLTLRDHILMTRISGQQDMEALAELIVRRADPPVSIEEVGNIQIEDVQQVVERLGASLQSVISLEQIIKSALPR